MKIGGRMDASASSMPARRNWLGWAIAVLVVVEAIHVIVATLVNDWDGWGTFLVVLVFALVSGLVIVGLTYGLLVRWGMKPHPRQRNRPAAAALAAGMLSVVSYAAFFVWARCWLRQQQCYWGVRASFAATRVGMASPS